MKCMQHNYSAFIIHIVSVPSHHYYPLAIEACLQGDSFKQLMINHISYQYKSYHKQTSYQNLIDILLWELGKHSDYTHSDEDNSRREEE